MRSSTKDDAGGQVARDLHQQQRVPSRPAPPQRRIRDQRHQQQHEGRVPQHLVRGELPGERAVAQGFNRWRMSWIAHSARSATRTRMRYSSPEVVSVGSRSTAAGS